MGVKYKRKCKYLFIAAAIAYWRHLSSLFFGFIVAFLFFNHLGESIYDPSLCRLILLSI